jgi:hypothetical protein
MFQGQCKTVIQGNLPIFRRNPLCLTFRLTASYRRRTENGKYCLCVRRCLTCVLRRAFNGCSRPRSVRRRKTASALKECSWPFARWVLGSFWAIGGWGSSLVRLLPRLLAAIQARRPAPRDPFRGQIRLESCLGRLFGEDLRHEQAAFPPDPCGWRWPRKRWE